MKKIKPQIVLEILSILSAAEISYSSVLNYLCFFFSWVPREDLMIVADAIMETRDVLLITETFIAGVDVMFDIITANLMTKLIGQPITRSNSKYIIPKHVDTNILQSFNEFMADAITSVQVEKNKKPIEGANLAETYARNLKIVKIDEIVS